MRWLVDENFNNNIARGLRRRSPQIDLIRVQDAGLGGARDETVLAWAADSGRILLSHDVTLTAIAYDRLDRSAQMAGLIEVPQSMSIRSAIDDILLIEECSSETEWNGGVWYLPPR